MISSRLRWITLLVGIITLGSLARTASAMNGSWTWGPPGFSAGMSPMQREYYLVNQGLADPNVNYWTPFWQSGHDPNVYTGTVDTGLRNTFAVNHDINANFGIPLLGYLDVFTPLLGTNELQIAATVSSVWNSITSAVSSVWHAVTSLFSTDYTRYSTTGGYSDAGWDNGFDGSFDGYDGGGGCGFSGGGDGESLIVNCGV
jgi:hypothetical protein